MENIIHSKPISICLNMIVKNESKIILRLLKSVYKIIDTFCICDTGSKDNTIELIANFFKEKGIFGKILKEPFQNFEYNRNYAMDAALGMSTHLLLLDADMELYENNFNKNSLNDVDMIFILQGTVNFQYKNVRIVKNDKEYRYIGVTHEYINSPDNSICINIAKDILFINDYYDGGSKIDKFERDIYLLTEDLKKNNKNMRSIFYLANSYYDSGKFTEAIEYYKKRIEIGGWTQEIWFSYYRIGLCYEKLGEIEKAIYNWMEGYMVLDERLENIFRIIHHYRNYKKNKLAMNYVIMIRDILKKHKIGEINRSDYLFLEEDVYTCKIDYEIVIISYYVEIYNIDKQVVNIFNNSYDETMINTTLSNMKFYKNILPKSFSYSFNDTKSIYINGKSYIFFSSSPCILKDIDITNLDGYIMNIRYVNYELINNYTIYNYDTFILSVNKFVKLNKNFEILESTMLDKIEHTGLLYGGVDDIRLYYDSNHQIQFIGTGQHKDGKYGVVYGKYDILSSLKPVEINSTFSDNNVEKNWVFVNYKNVNSIIYSWFPLRICVIDTTMEKSFLKLIEIRKMPRFFQRVRGSTCGIKHGNELWFVNHIVSYESPRHYYHIITVFDENLNLLRYTSPFKFSENCIEYCLGLLVEYEKIIISFSENDHSTQIVIYDKYMIENLMYTV